MKPAFILFQRVGSARLSVWNIPIYHVLSEYIYISYVSHQLRNDKTQNPSIYDNWHKWCWATNVEIIIDGTLIQSTIAAKEIVNTYQVDSTTIRFDFSSLYHY